MRTFFGLTDEYMENIYEQFFFLKYSGGWSFSEAYNLPVGLRKWFVERLLRQLESEKEAIEKASKGASSQTLSSHNQPAPPPQMTARNRQGP
jgi:hypothetical protein|tara:strand:- start:3131 stop:3406 length:276 start_codon:yes stop_codon:yes gene_type:complete